ncbi:MAG: hypothetical protein JSU01_08275 [Bacteroidetes bacterium]|nr:hypothetical protein [Bacteroidota bacterium]
MHMAKCHTAKNLAFEPAVLTLVDVRPCDLGQTDFDLEAQEKAIMKLAKHNMSWRIYHDASYNFSDLAQIYIRMHRLSEAKWYLLQSNKISEEENDDKLTITNLVNLALVKNDIGDSASARTDLVEAYNLANTRGMKEKAAEITQQIQLLDQNKLASSFKYAEAADAKKDL